MTDSSAQSTVSDSTFHVWRALIALAHVDGRFSPDEWKFLMPQILDLDLSDGQREVLFDDMHFCRDVKAMFVKITEAPDRAVFFRLANKLVYIDGDFDDTERKIMEELQKVSTDETANATQLDFEQLCKEVKMAFADDEEDDGMDVMVSHDSIRFSQIKKTDK